MCRYWLGKVIEILDIRIPSSHQFRYSKNRFPPDFLPISAFTLYKIKYQCIIIKQAAKNHSPPRAARTDGWMETTRPQISQHRSENAQSRIQSFINNALPLTFTKNQLATNRPHARNKVIKPSHENRI